MVTSERMIDSIANTGDSEKVLPKTNPLSLLDLPTLKKGRKSKARGCLIKYRKNGNSYYVYKKGKKRVYLGDADTILKAIKPARSGKEKK